MPRLGGGWRNASGDGRNKSGLYLHLVYLPQKIAGEAGLPRGTPSVACHVWAAAGGLRRLQIRFRATTVTSSWSVFSPAPWARMSTISCAVGARRASEGSLTSFVAESSPG